MIRQMMHQGLPSYILQDYVPRLLILSAIQNSLQTGSLVVTVGHSDVFQDQPIGSEHLGPSDLLQVWLIQHQAEQLAPYDMPACAGANLAVLDTVLNTGCIWNKMYSSFIMILLPLSRPLSSQLTHSHCSLQYLLHSRNVLKT